MIIVKLHRKGTERILAACDDGILGQTFRGGDYKITVSETFYGGETVDETTFIERTKSVSIMNLVGNEVIDIALREGLISEECVITIGDVRHAQMVII